MIMPTNDNVIIKVQRQEVETITKSGILIQNKTPEKQDTGEVVAVGSGRILNDGTKLPIEVEQGNIVFFNKFAGTELIYDNEIYLIIKENDILAVIN